MKKLLSISLISLTLISCVTNRETLKEIRFDDFDQLTVHKANKIELKFGSIDKTPKYKVSIGESIYPNDKKFTLETPKTYQRLEDRKFELETEYFYTLSDSIVRVVMYEWTDIQNGKRFDRINKTKVKKFRKKYNELANQLNLKLGEPSFIEVSSDTAKSDFRDGIKWLNGEGYKAYLFILGDNTTSNRKIRLAIYKE